MATATYTIETRTQCFASTILRRSTWWGSSSSATALPPMASSHNGSVLVENYSSSSSGFGPRRSAPGLEGSLGGLGPRLVVFPLSREVDESGSYANSGSVHTLRCSIRVPEQGPCKLLEGRPMFSQLGPNPAEFAQIWETWTHSGQVAPPAPAKSEPNSIDLGRTWTEFDEIRTGIGHTGPNWPGVDQDWPRLDQIWPELGKIGPHSARFGPNSAKFGLTPAKVN